MDAVSHWTKQWFDFINGLRQEGFVDDQFVQLKKLQDENSPDFVAEVVSLFFEDSQKLLSNMAHLLVLKMYNHDVFRDVFRVNQKVVDFKQLDAYVHQFKGSSASIGAMRIKNICVNYRNYCEAQNLEGCLRCLDQIQQECTALKTNLDKLFMLEQQIVAAGGAIPVLD